MQTPTHQFTEGDNRGCESNPTRYIPISGRKLPTLKQLNPPSYHTTEARGTHTKRINTHIRKKTAHIETVLSVEWECDLEKKITHKPHAKHKKENQSVKVLGNMILDLIISIFLARMIKDRRRKAFSSKRQTEKRN